MGSYFIRNQQIVDESDWLIAFPTKESKGTYDTIKKADKKGIIINIINV